MTEVLKQGYLVKSPPVSESGSTGTKRWKRRWFIVRNDVGKYSMQYFENEGVAASGQSAKGTILLQDCTCIHSNMQHSKYRNVFSVAVPTRTFYLVAESQMEMEEWTSLLCGILGFAQGQQMTLARGTAADAMTPFMPLHDTRSTFAQSDDAAAGGASTAMPIPAPRGRGGTLPRQKSQSLSPGAACAVPIAAGTGAQTLRRAGTMDSSSSLTTSQSPPMECLVNREMFVRVEKRFAMRSIGFVDAMGGVWIGGWSHNVPALSGLFKYGDQVLRIGGTQVGSSEEAQRAIDCFSGGAEMDILLLRTPWAMEVEIQRRSRSEPLGINLKENKITTVKTNGAASQCGMSERAVGITGDSVHWIVSEINGRPVTVQPRHKDDCMKMLQAAGMTVTILLLPEDFVKIIYKQLKSSYKNHQQYLPGTI